MERLGNMTGGIGPRPGAENSVLEAAFLEHRTPLLRLAWMLTGSRADAEDVVQSVFVRYGSVTPPPDNPRAYLRRMVVNAVHDLARRTLRMTTSARLVDEVDSGTELRDIWAAVQELPEDQREVIVLHYHDDLTQEEIAAALDCPIGTVRSRISRGLARLRLECHD